MLNLSPSVPWVQKSCLSKLPGGGKKTLVFCVSRLLGECGIWLLTLLSVSAVSGIDLMIPSVSANSVLKFSSFKLHKWFLSRHQVLFWQFEFPTLEFLPFVKQQVDCFPKWSNRFHSSGDNVWLVHNLFHLVIFVVHLLPQQNWCHYLIWLI